MFCPQTSGLLKLQERNTLSLFDGVILNRWCLLFPGRFPKLKIKESSNFLDCRAGSGMKKKICFHIWSNVSETGRWKILISLSLVWLPAVRLVIYLPQSVGINFLDHGLVIWAKTNRLVYPKELSDSLDGTPRISYSPHVSKSARLEPLDLQCPGSGLFLMCFGSTACCIRQCGWKLLS